MKYVVTNGEGSRLSGCKELNANFTKTGNKMCTYARSVAMEK